MAFNNDTYEQIQRYLEGEMSPSKRQAFEQAMAADEALAQEVNLQANIAELLADSPENALRKNLEHLSSQVTDAPKTSWKNFIWVVPLLLIVAIWLFNTISNNEIKEVSTSASSETPNVNENPSETFGTTLEETPIVKDTLDATPPQTKETTTPNLEQEKIKETTPKDSTEKIIYADNTEKTIKNPTIEAPMIMASPSLIKHDFFATLSILDSLIEQNFKKDQFTITINQKLPDTLLLKEVVAKRHQFNATLETMDELSLSEFGIYLYPNHAFYWNANHPWDFAAAQIQSTNTNTYRINIQPNTNLEPGLYYYAVRQSKTGRVYFVEKFVIEE